MNITQEKDIPRTFRLLEELEKNNSNQFCSYGLVDPEDNTFTKWNASIISSTGGIYSLSIVCDDNYPTNPPTVSFQSKINMACVDQTNGSVDLTKLAGCNPWAKGICIVNILDCLRKEMDTKGFKALKQPAEGTNF